MQVGNLLDGQQDRTIGSNLMKTGAALHTNAGVAGLARPSTPRHALAELAKVRQWLPQSGDQR